MFVDHNDGSSPRVNICHLQDSGSLSAESIYNDDGTTFSHPGILTEMYVNNFVISYSICTLYNNNNAQHFDHWSTSSSAYNMVCYYYEGFTALI